VCGAEEFIVEFLTKEQWMRFKLAASIASALLACVLAYGQRGLALAPDVIFFNGKIVTVDAHFTTQQAFAIKDDRLVAVGDNKSVRSLAKQSTRMIDLHNRTVIPGLSKARLSPGSSRTS
jgi:adenine deaminase